MFKCLAVQICPRTPFLVPGSLLKSLRPASRCLHVKKVSGRERYKKFTAPSQRSERSANPQIVSLREALDRHNWNDVESIYPQISSSLLSHHDTFRIAQLLHSTLRSNGSGNDALETKHTLLLATDRLAELYRTRVLPPHSGASLHLLSIYKENKELERGQDLWDWLSTQEGDDYVSSAVYGAAIEVLAHASKPLPELETLYEKALIRFPGTFASYHLSPEAVVPDRGQPLVSGRIPILLLQGIFTARLLNGDWRNAYLAFDVALRLIPDVVPKRFFDLIISERPLAEAIQVFKLACFAKVPSSHYTFKTLLYRGAGVVQHATHAQRLRIELTAIGVLEAQIAAGRGLRSSDLSQAISPLSMIAENTHHEDDMPAQFKLDVAECGSRLLKLCAPHVSGDLGSSLNALLHLAGRAKHKELLIQICRRIDELDTWSEVTYRTLVSSTGFSCDMDGLKDAWRLLVDSAGRDSREIGESDWFCLAGAVSRISSPDAITFATEQISLHPTTSEFQTLFQERCQPRSGGTTKATSLDENDISTSISNLGKALDALEARIRGPDPMRYFWQNPFPGGARHISLDGKVVRDDKVVYDELTVDPLQPPPPQTEAQMSKVGIPFDVLRFTHWKAINGLLLLAEGYEKSKKLAINDALGKGGPLKFNNDQASLQLLKDLSLPDSLEELRLRILQLRGRIE